MRLFRPFSQLKISFYDRKNLFITPFGHLYMFNDHLRLIHEKKNYAQKIYLFIRF